MSATDFDETFWARLEDTIENKVTSAVADALDKRLKPFQEDVLKRLSELEKHMSIVSKLKEVVEDVEKSLEFHVKQVQDIQTQVLPDLAAHFSDALTSVALQNVDLNVHRRKFSLVVQGIPGPASEDSADTRKAVISMAKTQMGVADAKE